MIVKTLLPNTALLIFTRSASLEAREKPLAFGKKSAQSVAQLLNDKVVKIADDTGLPYFIINEDLQKGVDFASRLDAAFQYVFDKGFDRVISIGNDCLGLSKAQILAATADLEQQDFVIGPTQQGGLYLFGLNFRAYQNLDFQALPWQTNHLFTCLQRQLSATPFSLKTYAIYWEVNHIYEWNAVFQQVRHLRYLIAKLKILLEAPQRGIYNYYTPLLFSFLSEIQQRGPPRI